VTALFESSGDLIADRRYALGCGLRARGDIAGAADLFAQAGEAAPGFTAAWFALGEAHEALGEHGAARTAFARALAIDPADRHGASLHLARLGVDAAGGAMPAAYVRAVFDQYAPRFDLALTQGLAYRAPELILAAARAACEAAARPFHFADVLDLGCGTGLGGAAFRPSADRLTGMDLSGEMIRLARTKEIYDRLEVAEIVAFLDRERRSGTAWDLVAAADVFAYFGDLHAPFAACARVMKPDGLLAFSVETHPGEGFVLGEKLRYAHSENYVRAALAAAGLRALIIEHASPRNEAGAPVPGLVAVATH